MHRPHWNRFARWLLLWAAASGCAAEREAALLSVYEVSPDRLEAGSILAIDGAGFPPGRSATIRFDGTLYRPGRLPEPLRVELTGRAVSAERVNARLSNETLEAFDGRATLRGEVTVLFAAAHLAGDVVGTSPPIVIDTVERNDASVEALERRRLAEGLIASLGVEINEPLPDTAGLEIVRVEEGSMAEEIGVVVGDRLVEIDRVRVLTLSDLVPPPDVDHTELRLERHGHAAPFVVRIPVARSTEGMRPEAILSAQLALGWMLLVMVLLAPSAGFVDWLGRRAHRAGGGRRAPGTMRQRAEHALRTFPVLGLVMAAAACVPVLDRAGQLMVPLEALTVGTLAIRISTAWLATTGTDALTRMIAVLHALGSATLIAIGILGVSSLGGTTDLSTLASQQGLSPQHWTLFATPLAPILGAALLIGAGSAPSEIARGSGAHVRVARTIDDALIAITSACAIGVLLGGWGEGRSPVQAGGYVLATVLTFVWLRRVRSASRITIRSALAGTMLGVVAVALSVARIALVPPPELEAALAQVTGGAVLLTAAFVVARVALGKTSRRHSPPHPFL